MPAAVLPDLENPSRTIPDALTLDLYRKMLTVFYLPFRITDTPSVCRNADPSKYVMNF